MGMGLSKPLQDQSGYWSLGHSLPREILFSLTLGVNLDYRNNKSVHAGEENKVVSLWVSLY